MVASDKKRGASPSKNMGTKEKFVGRAEFLSAIEKTLSTRRLDAGAELRHIDTPFQAATELRVNRPRRGKGIDYYLWWDEETQSITLTTSDVDIVYTKGAVWDEQGGSLTRTDGMRRFETSYEKREIQVVAEAIDLFNQIINNHSIIK